MRYADAIERADISYRQADYWRSCGYVKATAEGSGSISYLEDSEVTVLVRMATLVRAGMRPSVAARIARTSVEQGVRAVDLPGRLRVIFDVQVPA